MRTTFPRSSWIMRFSLSDKPWNRADFQEAMKSPEKAKKPSVEK